MTARLDAVCVSGPRPIRLPRAGDSQSAIDKRPSSAIQKSASSWA